MPFTSDKNPSEKEQPRSIVDRRQYSYTHHIPERRSGKERRHDDNRAASNNHTADDSNQNSE